MQISRIQNVFKNNFQYKFKPAINPISFQGIDTFEHNLADNIVVSKKYCRGDKEYDPNQLMQQGQTLFIKEKGRYIPYYASLKEYNAKGELIKDTSYSNGTKYIVSTYKNGQKIQEDRYENVYGSIAKSNQRTSVAKLELKNEVGKKPLVSFVLTRNYGKDWQKHPRIVMRKMGKNNSLMVYFGVPSDEKRGEIQITHIINDKTTTYQTPIYGDTKYILKSSTKDTEETAYLALEELKEVLQNEEFRADFGNSEKINSELNKAIEFLSSKINED